MPRPVRMFPVPRGLGEGRLSQPYASAAALTTAMDRARLNPVSSVVLAVRSFKRNASGSAFAAAASSSMNDSEANVDCGPLGSRRFPVRSGVSHTRGRLTTWRGHAPVGDGVHFRRRGRAARGGPGTPRPHELSDQYGIGLVVAEVIVVGGLGVVVERHEVSLGIQPAAQLERERRALGIPGRLFVPSSTAREPGGRSPSPDRPPRIPHRRRRCGRTLAGLPSTRHALSPAASRETWRRLSACRRTSCHWNRSSSGRSTDPPWHGPDRSPCAPGTAHRIRLR